MLHKMESLRKPAFFIGNPAISMLQKMETLRKPLFFIGNPAISMLQKMETLRKPLFFIGNPAIPGLGNIILLHSGDSGVSYETIRVSAHLSLGLPSSLSKNKGFLNVSTVFAPPYQKKQRFPKNFNHASTGWPANGCFAAVPYKFRVLYIMSALTGATRSAVLCPRFGPKMSWGVSFQGPPRHQERKRYVNVKKNLWAPKSTIHCWFVEACFSSWLLLLAPCVGSFRWLLPLAPSVG